MLAEYYFRPDLRIPHFELEAEKREAELEVMVGEDEQDAEELEKCQKVLI